MVKVNHFHFWVNYPWKMSVRWFLLLFKGQGRWCQ